MASPGYVTASELCCSYSGHRRLWCGDEWYIESFVGDLRSGHCLVMTCLGCSLLWYDVTELHTTEPNWTPRRYEIVSPNVGNNLMLLSELFFLRSIWRANFQSVSIHCRRQLFQNLFSSFLAYPAVGDHNDSSYKNYFLCLLVSSRDVVNIFHVKPEIPLAKYRTHSTTVALCSHRKFDRMSNVLHLVSSWGFDQICYKMSNLWSI